MVSSLIKTIQILIQNTSSVIKIETLKPGDFPVLFRWAQSNNKGPYKRARETGRSES